MKIKNIKYALLGAVVLLTVSCTSWLEEQRYDRRTDQQSFESEKNINITLNGMYLRMAGSNLYGGHLTNNFVEILAQYFYFGSLAAQNSPGDRYYASLYDYTNNSVATTRENIWRDAYGLILNINFFIEKLSETEGVISQAKKDILLGEAYAMRAYVHLDLLRLFGPVYSTNKTELSIPYYTKAAAEQNARETAEVVMDKILGDIETAIRLLQNDPVRTDGVKVGESFSDDFYSHRNRRLNYYAAQALKVRALMYSGNTTDAGTLAAQLLQPTEIPDKFPWHTTLSTSNPDRIFSSEVLFGVHVDDMQTTWNQNFSMSLPNVDYLLASRASNITYMYAANFTSDPDNRARNFALHTNSDYICWTKFNRTSETQSFTSLQPLIRKSELYYALSEINNDVVPLNEVLVARQRTALSGAFTLSDEICKEYMREFMGEGQLYFYYKRLNIKKVRSGSGSNTDMHTSNAYVVPIPNTEHS